MIKINKRNLQKGFSNIIEDEAATILSGGKPESAKQYLKAVLS